MEDTEQRGPGIEDGSEWSNGMVHFDRTGVTEKRGPPWKVDRFFRNFSGWTERIHSVLDRNFWKFWLNGSCPYFKVFLKKITRTVFSFHSKGVSLWQVKLFGIRQSKIYKVTFGRERVKGDSFFNWVDISKLIQSNTRPFVHILRKAFTCHHMYSWTDTHLTSVT